MKPWTGSGMASSLPTSCAAIQTCDILSSARPSAAPGKVPTHYGVAGGGEQAAWEAMAGRLVHRAVGRGGAPALAPTAHSSCEGRQGGRTACTATQRRGPQAPCPFLPGFWASESPEE